MGWVKRHKNLETVMLMTEPIFTSLHADHSAGRGAASEEAAPFRLERRRLACPLKARSSLDFILKTNNYVS